jgi:hypothetical protein
MTQAVSDIITRIDHDPGAPPYPLLGKALAELQKTVSQLGDLAQTRPIGVFPTYYESHICKLIRKQSKLWIASDVLSYGVFSAPAIHEFYRNTLTNSENELNIILPTDPAKLKMFRQQIPPLEWDHRIKDNDQVFRQKISHFKQLCCDPNISTAEDFYTAVLKYERAQLAVLIQTRIASERKTNVHEVDMHLPMFLWIADDKEAIFSIPIDKSADATSSFEHGFFTQDRDLVLALRATWQRFASFAVPATTE